MITNFGVRKYRNF